MVILFKGKKAIKKVYDVGITKAVPFAGTDGDSMGVGLLYPEKQSYSLWGLTMPHDIVASYRGMMIAQEVPQFGFRTLCSCWYAGEKDRGPSDKQYIDEIKGMIGRYKLQQILAAPLPSFDKAIRTMQEHNINFDVPPFLLEIKQGSLTMTPTLEKVINDYSDKNLLFSGLAGDFEEAYETLAKETKGSMTRLNGRRVNPQHLELARAYVTMLEGILPEVVPDLETQYWPLVQTIQDREIDVSKFQTEDNLEWIKRSRTSIYHNKKSWTGL